MMSKIAKSMQFKDFEVVDRILQNLRFLDIQRTKEFSSCNIDDEGELWHISRSQKLPFEIKRVPFLL